ncbi:MAG: hypothetical protein NTW87_27505, partial [Planctomycetota bacterium]|nr:hypothetical protein [Planctomycetota bacterium]
MQPAIWMLPWLTCGLAAQVFAGEKAPAEGAKGVLLFTSFRGNGEDGLHLAYSRDGYTWTALKNDRSFLKPAVGGKLMRDPSLLQGPDGTFH